MSDWNPAVYWPAFAAAGMLSNASTILPGNVTPTEFFAGFRKPDVNPITGMRAAEYEIEYQYADAPTLEAGAEVIVDGVLYRVREPPEIRIESGAGGEFRCAYLTRMDECPP